MQHIRYNQKFFILPLKQLKSIPTHIARMCLLPMNHEDCTFNFSCVLRYIQICCKSDPEMVWKNNLAMIYLIAFWKDLIPLFYLIQLFCLKHIPSSFFFFPSTTLHFPLTSLLQSLLYLCANGYKEYHDILIFYIVGFYMPEREIPMDIKNLRYFHAVAREESKFPGPSKNKAPTTNRQRSFPL